jgi:hypothetical protein
MEHQLDATITHSTKPTRIWTHRTLNDKLKPLRDMTLLTPYEQYFIQSLYQKGQLIPEQSRGETSPLVQLAIDHNPHTIYRSQ